MEAKPFVASRFPFEAGENLSGCDKMDTDLFGVHLFLCFLQACKRQEFLLETIRAD